MTKINEKETGIGPYITILQRRVPTLHRMKHFDWMLIGIQMMHFYQLGKVRYFKEILKFLYEIGYRVQILYGKLTA